MVMLDLIRHAKTSWNLEKKLQGKSDIALAQQGIDQALAWGHMLGLKQYDLILSSPMIRAKQTSQIIADKMGVPIEYSTDLREQDFGQWEGKKIEDIRMQFPGEIEKEESRGWAFCPPGGESRLQVLKRVQRAIDAAGQSSCNHILVVCHSSVIKTIIYKVLNRDFMPGEPAVLKNYHLHELVWDKKLKIKQLNGMKLS